MIELVTNDLKKVVQNSFDAIATPKASFNDVLDDPRTASTL